MSGTAPLTPVPELDDLVRDLRANVRAILGERLVGMYLAGSLDRALAWSRDAPPDLEETSALIRNTCERAAVTRSG